MIRAVLFDADDTLYKLNRKRAAEDMLSFLEAESGIRKGKIEKAWVYAKKQNSKSENITDRKREISVKQALEKLGVKNPLSSNLSKKAVKIFEQRIVDDILPTNYVNESLVYLKAKYALAVGSEEFSFFLKKKLSSSLGDYKKFFSLLITPEKTKEMKPSGRYCQEVLKKFKIKPSELAVVGNSWKKDLSPAKSMGAVTILFGDKLEGSPTHWVKEIKELEKIL